MPVHNLASTFVLFIVRTSQNFFFFLFAFSRNQKKKTPSKLLNQSICLWTYLFNTHAHTRSHTRTLCTHTVHLQPSPLSTEESRSEHSAKIVCDVKFWRIKVVSSNNIIPARIERRVNFSYTWRSSWKTQSSPLLKDNAIPVTPHLND